MRGINTPGLDRFGRIVDQRWINGSGTDVDRYQYGYDEAVIGAYGVDGAHKPLHRDTLFPVASLTKLATALAILTLVDKGRLDTR